MPMHRIGSTGRGRLYVIAAAILLPIASPGAARGQLLGGSKKSSKDPASFSVKIEPAEIPRGGRGEIVVGYEPGASTGKKHKVKVELVDKSAGKIRDGERTLVR